jgi:hypothetical protein
MDRLVELFLVEALVMVVCVEAVAALVMVVQALRGFCLSVFFASVNCGYNFSFDYALFADDC